RACHGGIQEQISIGGTRGFRVVGNRVHDAGGTAIGGEGICLKDGSSDGVARGNTVWNVPEKVGIYVDAWDKHTHDIEVDGNVVHDCIYGINLASEMGGLLERIRVTNNLCFGNSLRGLTVGDYGGVATHPMNDLQVVNNTFAGNGTSGWGGGIAVDSREARNVVVRNNVVIGHPSFGILVALAIPAGSVTVDHNLIDAYVGTVEEGETRGTDAVEADPRFVDASARDYHLSAGSSALDRGNPALAPSVDFDGVSRPQGSAVDLGAFERPAGPVSASATLFVPVVLRSEGRGGSFFTSELTMTNRGEGAASVKLDYTGVGGWPIGSATTSLGPRRQVVLPDAIAWLRSNGVPIPATGNAVGTLRATFSGLAAARDPAILVRTTTPVPPAAPVGGAGLSYDGVRLEDLPSGPVFLGGLRSDAPDRSNVAVQNAGAAGDGDATLRVTLVSGGASPGTTVATETVTLAPGGFIQIAVPDGFFGTARVERIAGTAPFYAYGVVNDNANSDGSFVAPVTVASLGGSERITLPVVVEASVFTTEVVVANASDTARRVHLTLHTEALGNDGAAMTLDVPAGGQVAIPDFVAALRARGVSVPTPAVGPLLATADGDSTNGLYVGGRTGSPGGGGRYGLFCPGIPTGLAAAGAVWLNGLQQTTTTRTNLALVNTGEADGSTDILLVEIWDGATGAKAGETNVEVGALRQVQVNAILTQVAPGTTNGYARITRVSGANPFIAYAVLNDGAVPGARSGDGAWVTSD
ncbi:MAG: right-handed parallel beta-helix repeat-containing protein, partial [Deltaproteobacteria bacterium]|nr:right-handed parallel beta-helix repeat-containing protein [Deltaproteobacteria bacterium]